MEDLALLDSAIGAEFQIHNANKKTNSFEIFRVDDMGICGKCCKQISSFSNRKIYDKELFPEISGKKLCHSCYQELTKVNKICPKCGKKLPFIMERVEKWKSKEVHPEWLGQILHPECFDQEKSKESLCLNCGYCDEIVHDLGGIDEFGFDDESYSTYKCRKFSFQIDKSNNSKAKDCLSYLNKVEYQEKCLKGEIGTEKQNVQLVLDFSSLKEVMNKGGLVMTTYKCPNCNGMVNIPEAGKVLVCQYCGIPIKPVDIFEKIKLLIQ